MVRCLILKMFRVYARSAPLAGLPALGIGVAGGTGNGLVSGLRPLYNFFQMLQMRALDPQPVTRFNWGSAIARAREQGVLLAAMAGKRHPFEGLEERFLWYDDLPYLSMSRAAERRLLAALATEALPDGTLPDIARVLASADRLAAKGEALTVAESQHGGLRSRGEDLRGQARVTDGRSGRDSVAQLLPEHLSVVLTGARALRRVNNGLQEVERAERDGPHLVHVLHGVEDHGRSVTAMCV